MTSIGTYGYTCYKIKHMFFAIHQFYNMIKTQFKTKILMIKSDNGSEFIQTACLDFFASKGSLH